MSIIGSMYFRIVWHSGKIVWRVVKLSILKVALVLLLYKTTACLLWHTFNGDKSDILLKKLLLWIN